MNLPSQSGPEPPVRNLSAVIGGITALIAGGLVLFLEIWTVVPGATLPTLALAAVVPELTPWAAGLCLIAGAVAQVAARGWARTAGVLAAACALGLALSPWFLLPATIGGCERAMRDALGQTYTGTPAASEPLTSQRPYSLAIALAGYPNGAAIRLRRDVAVWTRDGVRLGLDVYSPAAPRPRPTVVLIYGGAWIFGSRAESEPSGRALAKLGYTAIAIDYRHAPRFRYPTQLDDVRDALATIARNHVAWNVDPAHVAIWGRSAGAELALLAGYEPGPLRIGSVVAYYAPTDLVLGYRVPPRPDPADVDRILRAYTGGTPDDRLRLYEEASPITHVRPGLPPTLFVGGGRDELVALAFAHQMRDALRTHGVRVAALDLPWSNHAFDVIGNGTGAQLAQYYTERFLNATLEPTSTIGRHGMDRVRRRV